MRFEIVVLEAIYNLVVCAAVTALFLGAMYWMFRELKRTWQGGGHE